MVESASINPFFKPIIVIPVYNHEKAIETTLLEILKYNYPVVLVNDGSSDLCREVLQRLASTHYKKVYLIHLEINSGKGAAVKAGFKYALTQKFSHALQIDADGQHNIADLPIFLEAAERSQKNLICGFPVYDESVPLHRYYARYLTHVWVWINTLSFSIKDSMCGFRVYPLDPICKLIEKSSCGNHMEFDTEVIVRWVWAGYKVENLPTKVHYPESGISHFNKIKDNILISWMHTRLFFGMAFRSPLIIWNKLRG